MIEQIAEIGDDALSNLFELTFASLPTKIIEAISGNPFDLAYRVQSFTIPSSGANIIPLNYKTQTITKVGGKVDVPNEFTFAFRVDRNWKLYQILSIWKNLMANSRTGAIGDNPVLKNLLRTTVIVNPIDGNGQNINE